MTSEEKHHTLKSLLPSAASWAKNVAASIIATATALITTYKWIESHATEDEVRGMIAAHDVDDASHPELIERVLEQAEQSKEASLRLERMAEAQRLDHDAVYWSYWVRVGEKAAELERDGRKVRATAAEARDRFEAYYRSGNTLEAAFRRALRTPVP